MHLTLEATDAVVLVTGAGGALGGAVAATLLDAGATVCGVDVIEPESWSIDPDRLDVYTGDLTDEATVESVLAGVIDTHDRLDAVAAIAGTWAGGSPVAETDIETFERLVAVNLRTTFLTAKHAIPHLRASEGALVTVASESSLTGGAGDASYRAAKAGVRLLTESIAAEEPDCRANAILPGVIDTPANREAMPDADRSGWVDPDAIAAVVAALCADAFGVCSGATIPVSRPRR